MKFPLFIISVTLLTSCGSPVQDFEEAGGGIQFKLISFSGGPHIGENSFFLLDCSVCSDGNCRGGGQTFALCETGIKSDFWSRFSLGDKIMIRLDSTGDEYLRRFSGNSRAEPDWPLVVRVEVAALYRDGRYFGDEDRVEGMMKCREDEMIKRMMRLAGGDFQKKNDCWISISRKGEGLLIERGVDVVLSYTTQLSDGKIIDAEGLQSDSFSFVYGQPDQILPGFEAGISELTAGSEAKLIIPSHLAFGKKGSTAGIVPPYEALQFNIKIISVKKRIL